MVGRDLKLKLEQVGITELHQIFESLHPFVELNVELNRVWRERAKTVILVTHDIQEAVFLSTRVLVMTARPGRIAASIDVPFGSTRNKELLAQPMFAQLAGEVRSVLYEADAA